MVRMGRSRTRAVASLAAAAFVGGCAGGGTPQTVSPGTISVVTDGGTYEIHRTEEIRPNQAVTVTRDQAWAILPAVYDDLGMEPDVRDPGTFQLGVSRHRFGSRMLNRSASDFFDCGLDPGLNRPIAGQMPIDAQVVTQVLGTTGGAELRTVVQGSARKSGGNAGIATCRSTGLLEILIGEMVQRLASGGG
jgi:hypothetical protein